MRVGCDLTAGGHLNAKRIKAQSVGIGFAARGDQNGVGVDRVLAIVLAQLVGDLGLGFQRLDLGNCGAQHEVQTLFLKGLLQSLLKVGVHARRDVVEEFDNGYFRA